MANSGSFSVVITATDNASRTINEINRRIAAIQAPALRMQQALNRFANVSGLSQIGSQFQGLARFALGAFTSIARLVPGLGALTGAGIIAGLVRLTTQFGIFGTNLQIAARRMGISTDQLQGLQGAARLAGSSAEGLAGGVKTLRDNLVDAVGGRAPAFVGMMTSLTVAWRNADGSARNVNDVLPQVADRIAALPDPTLQARAATDLFGGAAEDLLPFLRQGSAGIYKLTEMSKKYGLVTEADAAKARDLRMAEVGLTMSVDGLANSIGAKLAPVLAPVLSQMADWIAANREWIATRIGERVNDFVTYLKGVDWKEVGADIGGIGSRIETVVKWLGGWKAASEDLVAFMAGSFLIRLTMPYVKLLQLLALIPGSGVTAAGLAAAGLGYLALRTPPAGDTQSDRDKSGMPAAGTPVSITPQEEWDRTHPAEHWWRSAMPTWLGGNPSVAPAAPAPRLPGPRALPPLSLPMPGGMGSAPPFGGRQPSGVGEPRGIRNNNPLNLSYVPGQTGVLGSDGRFGIYGSMEGGVAAAEQQLLRYQDVYSLNTIRGIVSRWAPPSENDTEGYIAAVAQRMGVGPDVQLNLRDQATASGLIGAMAQQEVGRPLDPVTVRRGVAIGLGAPVNIGGGSGTSPVSGAAGPNGRADITVRVHAPPETYVGASTEGDLWGGAPRIHRAMPNVAMP